MQGNSNSYTLQRKQNTIYAEGTTNINWRSKTKAIQIEFMFCPF